MEFRASGFHTSNAAWGTSGSSVHRWTRKFFDTDGETIKRQQTDALLGGYSSSSFPLQTATNLQLSLQRVTMLSDSDTPDLQRGNMCHGLYLRLPFRSIRAVIRKFTGCLMMPTMINDIWTTRSSRCCVTFSVIPAIPNSANGRSDRSACQAFPRYSAPLCCSCHRPSQTACIMYIYFL